MPQRDDAAMATTEVEQDVNHEIRETQRAMREERDVPMPDENRPIDPNQAQSGSDEPGGQVRSNGR